MMSMLTGTMVNRMADHGMDGDPDAMLQLLRHVSCHRIHCYAMHFNKSRDADNPKYECRFKDVICLYQADQTLRRIIFAAIDPIEVSMRASWSHHVEAAYGPKGHLKSKIYKAPKSKEAKKKAHLPRQLIEKLSERNWSDLEIQPLSEKVPFGVLSRFVGALKESEVRQICPELDFGDRLASIIHHLTIVRNRCAHHWKIWDFHPQGIAKLKYHELTHSLHYGNALHKSGRTGIYNTLTLLAYMLKIIDPYLWQDWRDDLFDLMDSEPFRDLAAIMGFPKDWKKRSVWRTP